MNMKKKATVSKKSKRAVAKKAPTKKAKKKVLAIPKGYNCITPYLIVNNGAKAIEYYKKNFGAKEGLRMEQPDGKIGHAELKIGDTKIMLADECPEMDARSPEAFNGSPVSILMYTKNVDAVVELAVKNGAKLLKPVSDMFYGDRCGAIIDPFGHRWVISTHIEDVTPAKMRKRAAELFEKK